MSRLFRRIPSFSSDGEALDFAEDLGVACDPTHPETLPRLHSHPAGAGCGRIVGSIEINPPREDTTP